MKFFVITSPGYIPGEAILIARALDNGVDRIHLRKPDATIEYCRSLLQEIPAPYHSRIVIHDHFSLMQEFALGGVHLNHRHPEFNPSPDCRIASTSDSYSSSIAQYSDASALVPHSYPAQCSIFMPQNCFTISRSCHSLEEISQYRDQCSYLFLSPIFDSISKVGYKSHFTPRELKSSGLIDSRIIALGGINSSHIPLLRQLHFGGAALLGDIWQYAGTHDFVSHIRQLTRIISQNLLF